MKKILPIIAAITILTTIVPSVSFAADTACKLAKTRAYKSSVNPEVYYITPSCTKQQFRNESDFFSYFKSWTQVITIDELTLKYIPNDPEKYAPTKETSSENNSSSNTTSGNTSSNTTERAHTLLVKDGSVIKIKNTGAIYLVINNVKFHIQNMETLNELGIPVRWVEVVSQGTFDAIPTGTELNVYPNTATMSQAVPNYMLLKDKNSPAVYRVEPSSKDPKYQVLRRLSNEAALRKTGYRLDRIPQIVITEIPDLELFGVGSKTVLRIGTNLSSSATMSFKNYGTEILTEKQTAKNDNAYLRNEKFEGITYEYPRKLKVVRGFSYNRAFREDYMAVFTLPHDDISSLSLIVYDLPNPKSSYTINEKDTLLHDANEELTGFEIPTTAVVQHWSTDTKRNTSVGDMVVTTRELNNGVFEERITFIYNNRIFTGLIRHTTASGADLENAMIFVATTFKKT